MMPCLRKVFAYLVMLVFIGATASGCRLPWKSDEIVLDVPHINRTRVRQDAIIVLRQAAEDSVASTRFIALEAIPAALGARGGAICKQALDDPSPEVRASALGADRAAYKWVHPSASPCRPGLWMRQERWNLSPACD